MNFFFALEKRSTVQCTVYIIATLVALTILNKTAQCLANQSMAVHIVEKVLFFCMCIHIFFHFFLIKTKAKRIKTENMEFIVFTMNKQHMCI